MSTVPAVSLDSPLVDLTLSVRPYAALHDYAHMMTIREVTECTAADLLRLPNFGRKSLWEVKELLSHYGWRLKDEDKAPPRPPQLRPASERDAALLADVATGMLQKDAAAKYGISGSRAGQIVRKDKRLRRLGLRL